MLTLKLCMAGGKLMTKKTTNYSAIIPYLPPFQDEALHESIRAK